MFNSLRDKINKFIGKTEELAEKEYLELLSEQVMGVREEARPASSGARDEPLKADNTVGIVEPPEAGIKEEKSKTDAADIKETPSAFLETPKKENRENKNAWAARDNAARDTGDKGVRLSAITQIKGMFRKTIRLNEKDLEGVLYELQMDLLENDVAMETSEAILQDLRDRLLNRDIDKDSLDHYIRVSIKKTLIDVLTPDNEVDLLGSIKEGEKPYKIVFFGVNGTGKTTTIAKVARLLTENGFSVVLAAGDTFRAGAIEQIEKHADSVGVKLVKHQKTGDSAAVMYDAVAHARARNVDVVLADTAGRMQTNVNLMDEMKKIVRVNQPDLKIFVGDSLTGNDALEQAEKFNSEIGIDAIILTKMDADAKGGAALSISHVTNKPVIYVGVGQKYSDLKKFDREWFVSQMVD
jgi:fused signal recognition particle receptor